ncbi:MAG TPA: CDP-diacylglycerol--serine O-phosphatidyltransferase [Candidatus Sumerlaeota bacterium]|nr:CDP-diacylglycerol--serine O-phosphatidyltransferase [Candidatus Sumerlaeota bacterium]HPS01306.1 CDP-diacylglycerol--serine O-phosphatidyltransferase [Candidatus Sumerlaeota bacterium]
MLISQNGKTPIRKIYILPNLFTALNMFLGLAAIFNFYLAQDNPDLLARGCWFIIFAAISDGFDGAVARLTKTQSTFGMEFDSLADLVSFGVAPAVAAFHVLHSIEGMHLRLLVGLCALYTICDALRLARYNVGTSKKSPYGEFFGLPSPAAAGGVILACLMIHNYNLLATDPPLLVPFLNIEAQRLVHFFLPLIVFSISLLMVCEIPYRSLSKRIRFKRQISFETLVSVILIGVPLWAMAHEDRVILLFILTYGYLIYAPIMALYRHLHARHHPPMQEAPNGPSTGNGNSNGNG